MVRTVTGRDDTKGILLVDRKKRLFSGGWYLPKTGQCLGVEQERKEFHKQRSKTGLRYEGSDSHTVGRTLFGITLYLEGKGLDP